MCAKFILMIQHSKRDQIKAFRQLTSYFSIESFGKKKLSKDVILDSSVQMTSLAAETGEIVVALWAKHGLRSDLRAPNFDFPREHVPRPL